MPAMQSVDSRTGDTHKTRRQQTSNLPVCEPAQVQIRRNNNWPFLVSYKDGVIYINKASRKLRCPTDVGEALM